MNTIIGYGLYAYFAIGIKQSILALADVHVAEGTAHRFNGSGSREWYLLLAY